MLWWYFFLVPCILDYFMPCFYLCYFLCLECPLYLINAYLSFEIQPGSHLLQEVSSEPLNYVRAPNLCSCGTSIIIKWCFYIHPLPQPPSACEVSKQSKMALFTLVIPHLAVTRTEEVLSVFAEQNWRKWDVRKGLPWRYPFLTPLFLKGPFLWVWSLLLLVLRERSAWW